MIFKSIVKTKFTILFFLFSTTTIYSQVLDGVRIGGGIGSSYYWGTQSDNIPKLNTYGKNELNIGYNFHAFGLPYRLLYSGSISSIALK